MNGQAGLHHRHLPGARARTRSPSPTGVKKTMAELKPRFPADLDYVVLARHDACPSPRASARSSTTLVEAMVLVILVVFLFLQNWRATLIPMIAVPVSLIGTFAVFPLLGFSINTLSLFGLVLAIGLVVDDAIVVVEAVEHHIEEGMAPRDATLQAMKEVSGPVIGIALILSSVFVPDRVHERDPGAPEQAVRRHDRDLGPDLGVQRAVALAGAVRAAAPAAQGEARAARALLRGVQPLVREGDARLRERLARPDPQGARHGGDPRRASSSSTPSWAAGCRRAFCPEEDPGYLLAERPASARGVARSGRTRSAGRSRRSSAETKGVQYATDDRAASAC